MESEKGKKEREILLAGYEQLDDVSQRILQLASVIYMPVNRTDLTACASKAGIRGTSDKAFTSTQLKPYFDKLLEQGLFVQEKSQGPKCHPLIAEILTRQAVKAGHFDAYVKAVREKWPLEKERRYGWYGYPEDQFRRDV